MRVTDQDRLLPPSAGKSPLAVLMVLLLVGASITGIVYFYLNHASDSQRQQLNALKNLVDNVVLPTEPTGAGIAQPRPVPLVEPPAQAPAKNSVAANAEPIPSTDAPALPALDDADDFIKTELRALMPAKWQTAWAELLVSDQLLRRFVIFINNVAVGKIDHKSGPFAPLKGKFSASGMPFEMTTGSQQRYDIYVNIITALDAKQCAALYQKLYPLLRAAYEELGEPGNFHAVLIKALQVLLETPDLTQRPALMPAEKGLYKFAEPQLEVLPPAQKQMLRMGWENVSHLKIWLRQCKSALQAPQA